MTRLLFITASALGAAAIAWMGLDFFGSHTLALAITLIIAGVFAIGLFELVKFRRATASLATALTGLPAEQEADPQWLNSWLAKLDASLINAVRLRVEGERVGLPAPVLTPYLVGLLVMLGLLGTFAGMVETLGGAVIALQGSTELEAIRNGLAAPIQGLGLAFGTSVAGVAASAMLGLNATLCRRERMLVTRQLDTAAGTTFQQFSNSYQQMQTFAALRAQADALPAVAAQLSGIAEELASRSEQLDQGLNQRQAQFLETANDSYKQLDQGLNQRQTQFLEAASDSYKQLAESVGSSLNASLGESGRLAGDSIRPVVSEAMAQISELTSSTQQQLLTANQAQLESISSSLATAATDISSALNSADEARFEQWSGQLQQLHADTQAQQLQTTGQLGQELGRVVELLGTELKASTAAQQASVSSMSSSYTELLASSEQLVNARIKAEESWLQGHDERLADISAALSRDLEQLREGEERRTEQATERLAGLEKVAAQHLSALGRELEAPMTNLIETASKTPAAAAEVITVLRGEISKNIERDNSLLEERGEVLEKLTHLADSLAESTDGQRTAIEQLVNSSTEVLQGIGSQFSEQLSAEAQKMTEITSDVAERASQMANLGDAFGSAMELYNESNQTLIENLGRIEASLNESTERSDEQMGYYVAQAREIIDQSMSSQRAIIDELRQSGRQGELLTAEAG
jgi:hypothetical protein